MIENENDKANSWTFYDRFRSFFTNYIDIFHKTEALTVILVCPICINLNWIKSNDMNHNFVFVSIFQFCKKKKRKFTNHISHFTTIYGHLLAIHNNIFHKTEVQTIILRCLGHLYLNWIKSYEVILVKNIFFSCLKMYYFRANVCSIKNHTKHSSVLWLSYRFFEELLFHIANLKSQNL